jgi:hypothetical protein
MPTWFSYDLPYPTAALMVDKVHSVPFGVVSFINQGYLSKIIITYDNFDYLQVLAN